jgi:hypothetical protein
MNCPYNYDEPESRLEWLEDRLQVVKDYNDLKLERDALWVKTQEDEREINDLRDAVDEKQRQRDEAIRLATLFQTLYLRLGRAEDEFYNTLMVQRGAKSLADLKGLRYFGEVDLEEV